MNSQIKNIVFLAFLNILFSNVLLVPEDYSSIQEAINSSAQNDTVLVGPGLYVENLFINNISISIVSSDGANNTIIDGSNNNSVININSSGNNVLINGFTVKNGVGDLFASGSRYGGGIISRNTILTLDSLIVENNESFAGGGVCIYDMESSSTQSIIKNSIIKNNIASEGGGVFVINQSLDIINSTIDGNGMIPFGSGGGVQALAANINLLNTNLINNHSRFGGGIYIGSSISSIEKTIISNNISDSKGGGIWVGSDSNLDFSETLITDNFSDGFGGGIFISSANLFIDKSTIANNIVTANVVGAGLYINQGLVNLSNSIVYFNRIEGNNSINDNLGVDSSILFNSYNIEYSNIEGNEDLLPLSTGVIYDNPNFDDNSYFLLETSPCIDSGNPLYTDPDGTRLDIGAYYYNQNSCSILGDLNNDNTVNILDVLLLVNIILDSNSIYNMCNDINQDTYVDILDVLVTINIIFND